MQLWLKTFYRLRPLLIRRPDSWRWVNRGSKYPYSAMNTPLLSQEHRHQSTVSYAILSPPLRWLLRWFLCYGTYFPPTTLPDRLSVFYITRTLTYIRQEWQTSCLRKINWNRSTITNSNHKTGMWIRHLNKHRCIRIWKYHNVIFNVGPHLKTPPKTTSKQPTLPFVYPLPLWWVLRSHRCLRPYHVENTGSRPITEVKQRRAWLVLRWVTAWEHHVL